MISLRKDIESWDGYYHLNDSGEILFFKWTGRETAEGERRDFYFFEKKIPKWVPRELIK